MRPIIASRNGINVASSFARKIESTFVSFRRDTFHWPFDEKLEIKLTNRFVLIDEHRDESSRNFKQSSPRCISHRPSGTILTVGGTLEKDMEKVWTSDNKGPSRSREFNEQITAVELLIRPCLRFWKETLRRDTVESPPRTSRGIRNSFDDFETKNVSLSSHVCS